MSLRIKVCGVTSPEDAVLCAEAGADMVGVIFARSPRQVDAGQARKILDAPLDWNRILAVGVFMDAPESEILETVSATGMAAVQLHGIEAPELSDRLRGKGLTVIKAMVPGREDSGYPADYFLLDVPKGETRDDQAYRAAAARLKNRLMLSGGLDVGAVADMIREFRPFGVDVCRATEASPGRKDAEKTKAFIEAVRHAEEVS